MTEGEFGGRGDDLWGMGKHAKFAVGALHFA